MKIYFTKQRKLYTYTWGIPEALNCLEQPSTNDPHGEGTTTVIHNAPWAVGKERV